MVAAGFDDEALVTNQTVVIDNGSGFIKAGFAGSEKPKVLIPSIVGRPKYSRVMAGAPEGDVFVGKRANDFRGLLTLKYPISHGIVNEWSDIELLWSSIFGELKIQSEEHPVLITEAPLNPIRNRERTAAIFFETYGVPAFFASTQAVLALYTSGRTSGVVFDSGDGVSNAVPVYEGFAIPHAIKRADLAGRDVTEYLGVLLRRAGKIFHTSAEMQTVRNIKESSCYVSFTPPKDENLGSDLYVDKPGHVSTVRQPAAEMGGSSSAAAPYNFQLPDGTSFMIGAERYRAPEILFSPHLIGLEYPGVHTLICTSIMRTDLDLRRHLFSQILLSGGTTLFAGFVDRFLHEIRKFAAKDSLIRIYAPPERQFSTFVGGSILASLATFKKMWVTKQEYDEAGPDIVLRRTF